MKGIKYFLIVLVVIIVDQASKLMVHRYMVLHEEINVLGEWFRLHYLLNPGMAFGIRWESEFGKLALTGFRIMAMTGITVFLIRSIRRQVPAGFLVCLAMILGGAIGNVIDSTFYGVYLHNAPFDAPTPWFHGQVIDMLFFPILEFYWPEWVPLFGGEYFMFFSPVFNIADSAIFLGVLFILIFQRSYFKSKSEMEEGSAIPEMNGTATATESTITVVPQDPAPPTSPTQS